MAETDPMKESVDVSERYGSVDKIPEVNEGYVLIFTKDTGEVTVSIKDGKLVAEEKQQSESSGMLHLLHTHKGLDAGILKDHDNLLKRLEDVGICYELKDCPMDDSLIIAIVWASSDVVEHYADTHDIMLPVNPEHAVREGRKVDEFKLAHNTYLDSDGDKQYVLDDPDHPKLPLSIWNDIHIPFEGLVQPDVYLRHASRDSVLSNRLYLRMLYDLMTEDRLEGGSGGAGFNVDRMMLNSRHPLQSIFALNLFPKEARPVLSKTSWWKPSMAQREMDMMALREVYGELIGFYFAFLVHYTKWLLYISPFGLIWFIVQVCYGTIQVAGGMVFVFIAILWSVLFVESWYKKENHLIVKWGMTTYQLTEVPRPAFRGKKTVSRTTGEMVEVVANRFFYYMKMMLSFSGIFLCILLVIACVAAIWYLKDLNDSNMYYSFALGCVNSLQIQVFNQIYTRIAIWLNGMEGHRLEAEYYDNLVTKRILFYLVNALNSLVYLAWFKAYDSNDECLEAVRLQIVTLFVTAIFFQNMYEIGFPIFQKWALQKWRGEHNRSEAHVDHICDNIANHTVEMETAADIEDGAGAAPEDDTKEDGMNGRRSSAAQLSHHCHFTEEAWEDAFNSFESGVTPEVLDNTAEIVVQYGYCLFFAIVFPIMPILAILNNYFEFRVDFSNYLGARRPVPFAAGGLGVWKSVIATFSTVAVFSNLAICTWKSDLVDRLVGSDDEQTDTLNKFIFFFVAAGVLLLISFVIRTCTPDYYPATKETIDRQNVCEKYILANTLKEHAGAASQSSKLSSKERQMKYRSGRNILSRRGKGLLAGAQTIEENTITFHE